MTERFDSLAGRIVIVGSGLAGLVCALMLAPRPVVLVTRAGLGGESSSGWAQGGIAASVGEGDDPAQHLADTLVAGDGLCDPQAAAEILKDGPAAIATLERLGVRFDRTAEGAYALGLEAAHSRRRIMHVAGDGCGAAVVHALAEKVRRTPSITILSDTEVRRLLLDEDRIVGVLCARQGHAAIIQTSRVVLATGGLGGLYEATTNPIGNYGQGIMLAARAGAQLSDMEFVQFHPTALASPRRPLPLVSEAVRGEGAILVNEKGERFLADEPGAELAPRDVVARAISAEIARGGKVFLDATRAIGSGFATRFPLIDSLCLEAGIDPAVQPIPVRPAVHYHMGGVVTDLHGRSTVEGLWVIGEAASTGLHGANRLASNSLLEAVVMGRRAAVDLAGTDHRAGGRLRDAALPPAADIARIRPIVSRHIGVLRRGNGLDTAIAELLPLAESASQKADPALVALLIAVFASLRNESRGAHARTDHPHRGAVASRRTMRLDDALDFARSNGDVRPDMFAQTA